MIKPNAGKMQGVRVMRDPDGILLDPFTDVDGSKYGYVIVYGEGVPSVFDGEVWHPVITGSDADWEDSLQQLIVDQGMKISNAAMTSPVYAELAKLMNIFVGVGASTNAPTDTVFKFGPNN
jgi:hypothetical protein